MHPTIGKQLLDIDLKALSEILDRLMRIIKLGKIEVDFEERLKKLNDIFYNKEWHFRLNYYKAAWKYYIKNDKVAARDFLLNNVKYNDISDLDFLQMYLELCANKLAFSRKMEVLDKLISLKKRPSGVIQYMGSKAINYFLIGDKEKAKEIFTEAISLTEQNFDAFRNSFDFYQLGNIYHYAGRFLNLDGYLEKSIEYFNKAKNIAPMNEAGEAMIYSEIGDVYHYLGDDNKALDYYLLSLKLSDEPLSKIFISQIYLDKEDTDSAQQYLNDIDYAKLSDEGKRWITLLR